MSWVLVSWYISICILYQICMASSSFNDILSFGILVSLYTYPLPDMSGYSILQWYHEIWYPSSSLCVDPIPDMSSEYMLQWYLEFWYPGSSLYIYPIPDMSASPSFNDISSSGILVHLYIFPIPDMSGKSILQWYLKLWYPGWVWNVY